MIEPDEPPQGRQLFAAAAVLLVVAMSLWSPFGVDTTPQGDGWILKNRVARGLVLFAHEPTRALLSLPWALAHAATPSSFVGAHLLFIAVIWAKGVALFALVRRLPGAHDGIAVLVGALVIVYPASSWTVALDAPLDRHWAVLFLLVSILCLMESAGRRTRFWITIMWAAQTVALWTNEAILPVALAVPGLVWWLHRGDRPLAGRLTLVWLIPPVVNTLHNLAHHVGFALGAAWSRGGSRGVSILAADDGIGPMLASMVVAYRKHLADCWIESARTGPGDWSNGVTALIVTIVVTATAVLVWPDTRRRDRRFGTFALVAGMLLLGLGFAPFAPTTMRFTDGRSFIVSSLGAVLAVAGGALLSAGRRSWSRYAVVALLGALVGLGANRLLDQRTAYDVGSHHQEELLRSIVEQAPRPKPNTVVAVVFRAPPGRISQRAGYWPRGNVVESALRFVYDDQTIRVALVYPHRRSRNRLAPDGLELRGLHGGPTRTIDYSRVLAFDGGLGSRASLMASLPPSAGTSAARSYDPGRLIIAGAPLPHRVLTTMRGSLQRTSLPVSNSGVRLGDRARHRK